MYNKNLTENFTAWGSEAIQDETLFSRLKQKELKRIARITISITDEKLHQHVIGNETMNWNTYIDPTTWEMQASYEAASTNACALIAT